MSTWNAAIVSAPRSTNIPAMQRKGNAMSSAAGVMGLIRTTAAPATITPRASTAKTAGSTKSKVIAPLACRAHRLGSTTRTCAQHREAPPLEERDPRDEPDHKQPARDRDRHA